MTYYEHFRIKSCIAREIAVEMRDGRVIYGELDLDRLNEYWREDGEPEGIAVKTALCLEAIYLQDVKSIRLLTDADYALAV